MRCCKYQRAILGVTMAMVAGPMGLADAQAVEPPREVPGLRNITVNADSNAGTLRPLQGVNGVPAPGHAKPFSYNSAPPRSQSIDVSAGYRMARIDIVRTHDAYGAADIDSRFVPPTLASPLAPRVPSSFDADSIFKDPKADPDKEASYNFGPTDKVIASITAIGANAIFRLGRSEGADATPPADFDKWAAVAKHVVLHYNKGWANGFHYRIKYWEVWNEPDLGGLPWTGTPEQYYSLYAKVARAVKAADSSALVGGPTLGFPNDPSAYREPFLAYVRQHALPFDFLSWHWYSNDEADPYVFVRTADNLEALVRAAGLPATPTILDEWNMGIVTPDYKDAESRRLGEANTAAFIVASIIYMQDAPILHQAIYRADADFGSDGKTPNNIGHALIATGRMRDTPVRLATVGGDLNGLAVQAGRSTDAQTVQVLISNYQIPAESMGPRPKGDVTEIPGLFKFRNLPRRSVTYKDNRGYSLSLRALKPRSYVVERYRIDSAHAFSRVDTRTMRGPHLHIEASLPPPGVELVVVKAAE